MTPTLLSAGSAAIIQYQEDGEFVWAIVLLEPIEAGTVFSFTDNGWQSNGTFRVGESSGLTFTANQNLNAGTVITFTNTSATLAGTSTSVGTVTGDPIDLSENGANGQDQIFMYQGSFDSLTGVPSNDFQFITAYHAEGAWQAPGTTIDSDELSVQPVELAMFSVDQGTGQQRDNAVYVGPIEGTPGMIWANLMDPSNWIRTSDETSNPYAAAVSALTDFTILGGDPVLTVPSGLVVEADSVDNLISGITVADADTVELTVRIEVEGTVSLGTLAGLTFIEGDGTDDATLEIFGAVSSLNAALATLTFTPTPGEVDPASIMISVTDGTRTISEGTFPATIALGQLDGTDGFVIDGLAAFDRLGYDVASAGDVNGDGIDDIIVGAPYAQPGTTADTGEAYVIYGSMAPFAADFDLTTLDGTNGFRITNNGGFANERLGHAVTDLGDINGDGFDDFALGSFKGSKPNGQGGTVSDVGKTWVVFGTGANQPATLEVSGLDGSNGFIIVGDRADDYAGRVVTAAGDVNGDGFQDILIGADRTDTNGNNSGGAYIIYGTDQGFSAEIDLEDVQNGNGSVGTYIIGEAADDRAGRDVHAAGDFNGDGIDDIIIGAYEDDVRVSDGLGGFIDVPAGEGRAYVVFGDANGLGGTLDLGDLDGSDGFEIAGLTLDDRTGRGVTSAGDINGDGIDDIVVTAYWRDTNGTNSGSAYVIFGTTTPFSANFDLTTLDGTNGFVINGENAGARTGFDVTDLGDINGDGIDDILIGGISGGGQTNGSYVVFGTDAGFSATLELSSLDGTNGFQIPDEVSGNFTGFSVADAGDVNNDGVNDLIIGASRAAADGNNVAGKAYVVFGNANIVESFTNGSFAIDLEQAPVVTDLDGDAATFTEGDTIALLDQGAAVGITDADSSDFDGGLLDIQYSSGQLAEDTLVIDTSGTVALSAGQTAGSEVSVGGTVIGTIAAGETGATLEGLQIALNDDATPARITTLLQAIGYANTAGDTPDTTAPRTLEITLTDGDGADAVVSTTVTVVAVDDAPVVTPPAAQSFRINSMDNTITGLSVSDADSASLTVTLTVEGTISLAQTTGLTIDAGADGSSTVTITGSAADLNAAIGSLTYTPATDDMDGDTLDISVTDGTTPVSTSVSIDLTNIDPVAQDDAFTVAESGTITAGDLFADNGNGIDSDADGDPLTVSEVNGQSADVGQQVTLTSGALLTVNANGTFDYDPNGAFDMLPAGQDGTDSFTYTVDDGFGGTDMATVTLTITGENEAPVAADDGLTLSEDGSITGANVQADNGNGLDTDPNGDSLTVTEVNGQAAGVGQQITLTSGALLTLNANGTFDYDPNGAFDALQAGQNGTDSFAYTVADGLGGTDTATVTLTLSGANDAPVETVPGTQSFLVNSSGNVITGIGIADPDDTNLLVTLSAEGTFSLAQTTGLSFVLGDGTDDSAMAFNGSIADINAALASITYTPTADDRDGDVLSVGAFDGDVTTTETIAINLDNAAPDASDDAISTTDTAAISGNVLADNGNGVDSDANNDPLTITQVNGQSAAVGSQIVLTSGALLTLNSDGTFDYDPNGVFASLPEGASDSDSFTYTVSDGFGGTDTATATITVIGTTAGNDLVVGTPVADTLVGGEGSDTLIGLNGNDLLNGGTGADQIDGGAGIDLLDYSGANSGVAVDFDTGMGTLGEANGDSFSFVEGAIGSGFADTFLGDDTGQIIDGGAGDDVILADGGSDNLTGGAGNDLVVAEESDPITTAEGQIYRLFQVAFGREPSRSEFESNLETLNATSFDAVAATLTSSSEFLSTTGAMSDAEFVEYLYEEGLGRSADAGGFQTWTNALGGGLPRVNLVKIFAESAELKNSTALISEIWVDANTHTSDLSLVYNAYDVMLGRAPDVGGLLFWADFLEGGASAFNLVNTFTFSTEFISTYGSLSDTDFVTALYNQGLDRAPDTGGLNFWVDFLGAGATRAEVAFNFVTSNEAFALNKLDLANLIRGLDPELNDVLSTSQGDDILFGGDGADTFVLGASDFGSHRVLGFEDWDYVDLSDFGYADLAAASADFAQDGDDVVFSSGGVTVVFEETTLEDVLSSVVLQSGDMGAGEAFDFSSVGEMGGSASASSFMMPMPQFFDLGSNEGSAMGAASMMMGNVMDPVSDMIFEDWSLNQEDWIG